MATRARARKLPEGKIIVENVNVPGWSMAVDAAMYEEMRRALLAVLPRRSPGLTQTEIRAQVVKHLSAKQFAGGAKANWWSKLVQLDLEAKRVVLREETKPLRWHLAR